MGVDQSSERVAYTLRMTGGAAATVVPRLASVQFPPWMEQGEMTSAAERGGPFYANGYWVACVWYVSVDACRDIRLTISSLLEISFASVRLLGRTEGSSAFRAVEPSVLVEGGGMSVVPIQGKASSTKSVQIMTQADGARSVKSAKITPPSGCPVWSLRMQLRRLRWRHRV